MPGVTNVGMITIYWFLARSGRVSKKGLTGTVTFTPPRRKACVHRAAPPAQALPHHFGRGARGAVRAVIATTCWRHARRTSPPQRGPHPRHAGPPGRGPCATKSCSHARRGRRRSSKKGRPRPSPRPRCRAPTVAIPGVKPYAPKRPSRTGRRTARSAANSCSAPSARRPTASPKPGSEAKRPATPMGLRGAGGRPLLGAAHRAGEGTTTSCPRPSSSRSACVCAEVTLFIGRSGELVKVKLAKSSGNELFDNAIISP